MKKLFACLLLIGTTGLASAQVSNFTGWSGAVNLSADSTNTKIDTDVNGLGGDNWIGSFQGAYGIEMSSSSVLNLGLTYAAGKSKSGSLLGSDNVTTYTGSIKSQYSLYAEPGTLLSDNTLLYGKISLEKGKFNLTNNGSATALSKSVSGTGYGVGLRHMLDKAKFVQVEFMKVGYKSITITDSDGSTAFKSSSTLGTIGIGMKF